MNNSGGGRSGNYGTADCDGECGAAQTCQARSNRWVCYRPASTDGITYSNATCDGSDANSWTDCSGGQSCTPLTYTCDTPIGSNGITYERSSCDSYGDGDTLSDCGPLYTCEIAYQCTKPYRSPQGLYGSSDCDNQCNASNGWSCTPMGTSTTVDWSGQACADCAGTCEDTGTVTIEGYDCLADSAALCDDYDGWDCTPHDESNVCAWTDYQAETNCKALALPGDVCVDDPPVPEMVGSCETPSDQDDCVNKYHGTCEVVHTVTTTRAPYWRLTPADASNPLGWNCTTGDCVGGTVTLGNRLNHDQMSQMDVAKKVLIGGRRAAVSSISGTVELDGDHSSTYYTCEAGGGTYNRYNCDNSSRSSHQCANGSACLQIGNNGNIVLQPGEDPKGILQNFEGLAWGFAILNDSGSSGTPDGGIVKNFVGDSNQAIVQAINDTESGGATDLAEALNTVVNYFRQTTPEYNTSTSYTCSQADGSTIGTYANSYCDNSVTTATVCSDGTECVRKSAEYLRSTIWDPFFDNDAQSYAPCGRGSVIVITDGEPNQDNNFNSTVDQYVDGNPTGISDFAVPDPAAPPRYKCTGNNSGTTYSSPTCDGKCNSGSTCILVDYWMDDVAYWAHTHDMRPQSNMGGEQPLDIYMIYAFGNDATSMANLKKSAVLGGFIDKNGDGRPNSVAEEAAAAADYKEWDTNGDGTADNYADASEGDQLGAKLEAMLGQIQQKVSAGSAASVISASRSGEGAIYQAIFYPKTPPDDAFRKITWVGDIHSLWLDDFGNIRADCDAADTGTTCTAADGILDKRTDKILELYSDPTTGESRIRIFNDADGNSKFIAGTCTVSLAPLSAEKATEADCLGQGGSWDATGSPDFISDVALKSFNHFIWSGGEWLAAAQSTPVKSDYTADTYTSTSPLRYIFTEMFLSGTYRNVPFDKTFLNPYLEMFVGGPGWYQSYMNASSLTEADNIVDYIRGEDIPGYRSRLYDWGHGLGPQTNKLGDIIGSTPTVVAQPAEDYDTIYLDRSYQRFRKKYQNRRTMVYTGGNDGGLHAFNGGYYDRARKEFLEAPPTDSFDPDNPTYKTAYDLGAEMWMYIPSNLIPHLKWLTNPYYGHTYYVDLKPYVFDAKIFTPDAAHPDGWGTVLVGGMGFGGGDISIDLNNDGVRETTLRSTYFIIDVTDPEVPPRVLGTFTNPNLGFTTGAPTAIPMLGCDRLDLTSCPANTDAATTWPMDWYLAFGSGPYNNSATNPSGIQTAMMGKSSQEARLFVVKLGGTGGAALGPIANSSSILNPPTLLTTPYTPWVLPAGSFPKSFFSDLIAVDYDLDYKTDVVYAGSIANTDKAAGPDYSGGMHRLVIDDDTNFNNWTINTFFNAHKPVSAAAAASYDGRKAWVYFGTGRLLNPFEDKADSSQQTYFGLKESYDVDHKLDLNTANGGYLVDVSDVYVVQGDISLGVEPGALYDVTTNAPAVVKASDGITENILGASTFTQLDSEIGQDQYDGWKIDFPLPKERNLGQASILGKVLTFTTYVPSSDICSAEGESFLWAAYYRTGTAYYKPIIGAGIRDGKVENLRKLSIGRGMSTTPSLHSGAESGSKAFIQTSTGAIIGVEQENPGVTKSGVISWRDLGADE